MNDNFKYIAKLVGKSAFSFIKINILGQIFVALLSVISILIIVNQSFGSGHGGGPAHANGIAILLFLFALRPVGFSLVVIFAIASPFLLFSLGNKYIVSKTINKLISDKGENILFPIIDKVLNKIKSKQPELFQKGADKMKLKLRLIQEIKDSNDNKWLKKIILYAFKKIDLNEVDFKDENLSFSEIIKNKIIDSLKNVSKPNRNFFWIIIGIQVAILMLIIFRII